jgi:hypothetical protein
MKKLKSPYNFSHTQLIIFALFFAAVGGYFIVQSFAASIYYLSPTGNDSNPCTQAQPCYTMNRAYHAASPGDTVEIAAGTYSGSGDIFPDFTKTSSVDVLFRPAPGATATFTEQLQTGGSHMTIDGSTGKLNIGTVEVGYPDDGSKPYADDITLANVNFGYGQSQILKASNVLVHNVDFGGSWTGSACRDGTDALRFNDPRGTNGDADDPFNITVEDSRMHDICVRSGQDDHPDCVAMSAGHNITFRRNKIWSCGTQGFYTVSELGGNIHDVLVENNMIGSCDTPGDASDCYYSVHIREGTANLTFRYNSIATNVPGGINVQGTTNTIMYGNTGDGPSGCSNATYSYNVWIDVKCSSTDVQADPMFLSSVVGPNYDLHLKAGSPAIGRGDASKFPSTDFDGQTRTSPPSAGADEYGGAGGGTPAPTVSVSASPTSITSGQSSTLFWNSTNATSCTASGAWSGTKAVSGNQLLSPTSTSTYTLTCTGTGGSGSASATVTVTTVSAKPGDLNGVGQVNITDLSILLTNYNSSNAAADINNDGSVNILDLSILLSNYGA